MEANYFQELLEVEKEIVREVARCDKQFLRKSADREAQLSPAWVEWTPLWFVLCDLQIFSGNVYHIEQPHAQSLFSVSNISGTVRSDVEEHVAKERLACNDKNISAWPKNISVLYNLAHHILHCTL